MFQTETSVFKGPQKVHILSYVPVIPDIVQILYSKYSPSSCPKVRRILKINGDIALFAEVIINGGTIFHLFLIEYDKCAINKIQFMKIHKRIIFLIH